MFHQQDTTGAQEGQRAARDARGDLGPVMATPIQGDVGVGTRLGLRGHLIGGNVGRVRDDDVDHAVQVRERRRISRICAHQVKAGNAHSVAVLTG